MSLSRWFVVALVASLCTLPTPLRAIPVSGVLNITGDLQLGFTFTNFLCDLASPTPCAAAYGNVASTGLGTGSFAPYANQKGFIHNLNHASGQPINATFSLANFQTFVSSASLPVSDIALDLTFIYTGIESQAQCGSPAAVGQSCTFVSAALITPSNPLGLSPLNFNNTQTGSTASFSVAGNARRISTGEVTAFVGAFTTQFTVPFQSVLATMFASGNVSAAYSATISTPVINQADLSITKTDTPDPVTAGANLTYTVAITNNGPIDAESVSLNDSVPANTTFLSLTSPSGWTCTTPPVGGTGAITCTRASLSVGPPVAFTIVVKVNPGVSIGSVITETATVSSATTDPNPANNSANAVTTVSGCGPHTTHLHISTVPPSHSGNVSHEHHGQHGHTVVRNCPPHAPGHSAGFKPDPGGELFSLPFAAEPQDFAVLGRGQGDAGPVKPGAAFQLFGSVAGVFLGDQDASNLTPPLAGSLRYYTTSLPVVRIGGLPAKVLFSGLAPGLQGVWQIEMLVPEGAPVGKLPVSVAYEGDEMRAEDVVVE